MIYCPVFVSVVFAYLIADCCVTVFEMTVDTIFICYCVDSEQNDGVSRPYCMSTGLMIAMREIKHGSNESANTDGKDGTSNRQIVFDAPTDKFVAKKLARLESNRQTV